MRAELARASTAQGLPALLAAILPAAHPHALNALVKAFACFALPPASDPRSVDVELAKFAAAGCPPHVPALCLCVHVPGITRPCGGIVGDPRRRCMPADGCGMGLGKGLSGAAYPGGPGLVVRGTPAAAEAVLRRVEAGAGGAPAMHALAEGCRRLGVRVAVAASDGTGGRFPGAALAWCRGRAEVAEI